VTYKQIRAWVFRNLANFVTALRFPFCFVLFWVVVCHPDRTITILSLVTGALLTDFFDGKTARYFKIVSALGGAMDRLADKLLLADMFIFLIRDGRIHLSLKIITVHIAVVETALLVYWLLGARKKMDVSTVKKIGKYGPGQVKMFLVSVAILLCLLNLVVEERWGAEYHFWATVFLNIMFLVSLFFAVKSVLAHRARYLFHLQKTSAK